MFLGPQAKEDRIPQSCMNCATDIQNREAAWKLSLGRISCSRLTLKLHPGAVLENTGWHGAKIIPGSALIIHWYRQLHFYLVFLLRS